MKWIIRILWCIPALVVNLLLRLAFDSVLDTSFKVWLFQTLYFLLCVWIPWVHLPKLYARHPRVRAESIARAVLIASSTYCRKAGLPDRMTVHLQVWCVYLYAILPLIGEHPVKQHINKACGEAMFKEYGIGPSDASSREAFYGLQYAFLTHLAHVEFNPHGVNPISFAFHEFWLESMTKDEDGLDLVPLLEDREHNLIYTATLRALEDFVADTLK